MQEILLLYMYIIHTPLHDTIDRLSIFVINRTLCVIVSHLLKISILRISSFTNAVSFK